MKARSQFLQTIGLYRGLASEPYLVSGPPGQNAHNDRARLLRNGLAIAAFASLESFLRDRCEEALSTITGAKLKLTELPEKLQRIATKGSIEGTRFRLSRESDLAEVRRVSLDLGEHLVSLGDNTFELGHMMFGSDSSNLGSESLTALLSSVGVSGGWDAMSKLSTRGYVGLDSNASFKTLSTMRHSAAHDPSSSGVSASDIPDMYLKCHSVAIPFDGLVSLACWRIAQRKMIAPGANFEESEVKVWRVEPTNSGWALTKPDGTLSPLAATTEVDAVLQAGTLARPSQGFVILVDGAGVPINWLATAIG